MPTYDYEERLEKLEASGQAAHFRELMPILLPTLPGAYHDSVGSLWVVNEAGEWSAPLTGETLAPLYHLLLVPYAPFTAAPQSDARSVRW